MRYEPRMDDGSPRGFLTTLSWPPSSRSRRGTHARSAQRLSLRARSRRRLVPRPSTGASPFPMESRFAEALLPLSAEALPLLLLLLLLVPLLLLLLILLMLLLLLLLLMLLLLLLLLMLLLLLLLLMLLLLVLLRLLLLSLLLSSVSSSSAATTVPVYSPITLPFGMGPRANTASCPSPYFPSAATTAMSAGTIQGSATVHAHWHRPGTHSLVDEHGHANEHRSVRATRTRRTD
jgi:hypothetical protein